MNKKTIKLISDLNSTYDLLWKSWTLQEKDSISFNEISDKLKLVKIITKNLTEQSRGFLRSKLDYHSAGRLIIQNISSDYESLQKKVNRLLLQL